MFIQRHLLLMLLLVSIVSFSAGCSDAVPGEEAVALEDEEIQAEEKNRVFGEVSDTAAALSGEVDIDGVGTFTFNPENVEIKAHNLRDDMFQPGVVTAIDTILSLSDAGYISYDLQWYESIGTAGVVKSYWVNRINDDVSEGRCGFVYEAGDEAFHFFRGNHNHIPSDVRVITSPQYVKYFWICI